MVGHFRAQGGPLKRKLHEFPVSNDALHPIGMKIGVRHFVPGQYVDVTGITRGKGFQGGMKRHGFSGMTASHGASPSHRSTGFTCQIDDVGKVFKVRKMPGRMGGKQRTVKNVWVYKIDPARNLMWMKGQEKVVKLSKQLSHLKSLASTLCLGFCSSFEVACHRDAVTVVAGIVGCVGLKIYGKMSIPPIHI